MTAVLLGSETPQTPAWHKLRSRGLGGSEIAAVVGLSAWVSRFSLWHRKRGTIGEQEANASMNWGTRLEPIILDAFEEHFPIQRNVGTYHHSERRWQIANPDAIYNDIPVDAKTADKNDSWEWGPDGSDEVPPYYRCQLIWYGDVFGVREGYLPTLIGGNDFRVYHLTWTEDEAAWLRSEGEKFWQSVLDGDEPPLDGSDSTYQAVRELHPEIHPESVEIPAETWQRFSAAKLGLDDAKYEYAEARVLLADAMGDAQYAEVNGERVARRQAKKGGAPFVVAIPPKKETAA